MTSSKKAVKLLRKCCDTTLAAVKEGNREECKKEDQAYEKAFEAMTGRSPTKQELRKIFNLEDEE